MAFKFKKIPLYIFIAANLLVIAAMNFCAYTAYLPPQVFPNWSYFGLMFPVFLCADAAFVVFWLVFKRRMALLPIVGTLACAGAVRTYCPVNYPYEAPDGSIKLLTYNVMSYNTKDNPYWADNSIVRYILDADADIVCLQEGRSMAETDSLYEMLHSKYAFIDQQTFAGNHLTLLSKYPVLSSTRVEYPAESNFSYAYDVKVGEDTIVVINNHLESYRLDANDKENYQSLIQHPKQQDREEKYEGLTEKLAKANAIRGAQVDSVASYVESCYGRYVVVCGDFNDPSISYTHHRLTRLLNDAYTRSGNGPGLSYNRSGMYFRIDNILCSENITPYGAKVDKECNASDHYPVYCYLKIEGK